MGGMPPGSYGKAIGRVRGPRGRAAFSLPAALAFVWGCSEAEESGLPETEHEAPSQEAPAPEPPPARSAADLDDPFFLHPRFVDAADRAARDPDAPFQPGATEWERFEDPLPTADLPAVSSPEQAVELWAARLAEGDEPSPEADIETVTRLRNVTDTTATGAVLRYGYLDDSVAGEAWRLDLVREEEGWRVRGAARRWFCRRGAQEAVCV